MQEGGEDTQPCSPAPQVDVKAYSPSDDLEGDVLRQVVSIERQAFPEHEALCGDLAYEVTRRNARLLLSTCGSSVLGYLLCTWNSMSGNITKLAVHHECRQRGLGKALVREAIALLRQRRVQSVTLHVDPAREPAVALYTTLGFVREGLVRDYYAVGHDASRMVLEFEDR